MWSRILGRFLGDVDIAHATVLGTFMGGLALGARVFGEWSDRLRRPLLVYGALEAGIGVYALLSPHLFPTDALVGSLGSGAPVERVVYAAAVLLPPTVLMGGSFPLLTRFLTSRTVDLRRNVGELYAVNTAGSVLGGLFAGFWLLGAMEAPEALTLMGACNLALGAFVLFTARGAPARVQSDGPAVPSGFSDAICYGPDARRTALWLAGFSGVATMALEVAWTRELAQVLGNTTHGLTLMLAALLSGSALGSVALASRWAGRFALPDLVGGALLVTSVCLAVTRPLFAAVPLWIGPGGSDVAIPVYAACFTSLLVPASVAGLIFPAAIRLCAAEQSVGGRVGQIYAVNTLGTLVGAVFAGLIAVPRLGAPVVFTTVTAAYALAGLTLAWRGRRIPRPAVGPLMPVAFPEVERASEDEAG